MKEILISALLASIMLTSASCGSVKDDNSSEKMSPESVAKKMADGLTTLTDDNDFLDLFGFPSETRDQIKNFQDAKVDTDTIYSLELEYDDFAHILHAEGVDLNSVSTPAKARIRESLAKIFSVQMSGSDSISQTNLVAITSVLTYSSSFTGLTDVNDQMWFMPTDKEGISVCVSFIETGESITTATASYFCYNNDSDLKQSINDCIEDVGITSILKER